MNNERRAPVQQDCQKRPIGVYCDHAADSPEHHPGTVAWWEHVKAWEDYARRFGDSQSAERIAQRGGFGYAEITDHLGHPPTTWKAS